MPRFYTLADQGRLWPALRQASHGDRVAIENYNTGLLTVARVRVKTDLAVYRAVLQQQNLLL